MFARNIVAAGIVGVTLSAVPLTAEAGFKLFGGSGSGAVFRGSVGKFLGPFQEKVLTPVVQAAVVVAATGGAVALAGPLAAPVGITLGNSINDLAAGASGTEPAPTPVQQAAVGGTCSTEVAGDFPLASPAPLGTPCGIKLPNGKELSGQVKL